MGATIVYKWKREDFTLECLLPDRWVTGSIINFFVTKWWRPVEEAVVVGNTYFWTKRLDKFLVRAGQKELTKTQRREIWNKVFKYRVHDVGVSSFMGCYPG